MLRPGGALALTTPADRAAGAARRDPALAAPALLHPPLAAARCSTSSASRSSSLAAPLGHAARARYSLSAGLGRAGLLAAAPARRGRAGDAAVECGSRKSAPRTVAAACSGGRACRAGRRPGGTRSAGRPGNLSTASLERSSARRPRGRGLVSIAARTSSGSELSGLVSAASSVLAIAASNLPPSSSASASLVARSEASGCQIAHASSSAATSSGRPRRRCAPASGRQLDAARRARPSARSPSGPRPGDEARRRPAPSRSGPGRTRSSRRATGGRTRRHERERHERDPVGVPVAPRRRRRVALARAGAGAGSSPVALARRAARPGEQQRGHDEAERCRGRPASGVSNPCAWLVTLASVRWRSRAVCECCRRRRPSTAGRRTRGPPRASTCRAWRRPANTRPAPSSRAPPGLAGELVDAVADRPRAR